MTAGLPVTAVLAYPSRRHNRCDRFLVGLTCGNRCCDGWDRFRETRPTRHETALNRLSETGCRPVTALPLPELDLQPADHIGQPGRARRGSSRNDQGSWVRSDEIESSSR